jgi:hypothetical protein
VGKKEAINSQKACVFILKEELLHKRKNMKKPYINAQIE